MKHGFSHDDRERCRSAITFEEKICLTNSAHEGSAATKLTHPSNPRATLAHALGQKFPF